MRLPATRQRQDPRRGRPAAHRKTMAIVTTVWRYLSHAQHMGDRFLVGYPYGARWHRPAIDVVVALRRPEARGRPERRARRELRLQGLSDDRRGPSMRRRRSWPSTAS